MAKQQRKVNPTGPGRRERRRIVTREKLFRAAMDLFSQRGFFATTTEDITKAADVGQGTFFNYFPSKQHVLTALFELQLAKVEAAQLAAESAASSVKPILRDLMHRIGEEPGRTPALTRSLIVAFLSNDAAREAAAGMLARALQSLKIIMRIGQKNGEIRRNRGASDLAAAYQKRIMGTLFFFALQNKSDLTAELDATFSQFWKDIAASSS